jgi:ABC-2 type transport system permease protein
MTLMNPVLGRELKERARGRRMMYVLFGYLGLLALTVQLIYWERTRSADNAFTFSVADLSSARTGRFLFDSILIGVLLLVCFLVPAFTAASIAGERDRQTLVPLQVTMLSARSIVVGKLLAGLALVSLLLVAAAPFLGVALILGGVTAGAIAKGLAMVLVTAVVLGSLSIACSSLVRRVQVATVAAYGLTLFLLIGTFVGYGVMSVFNSRTNNVNGGSSRTNRALLVANPLVATADLLWDRRPSNGLGSPLRSLQRMAEPRANDGIAFGPNGQPLANQKVSSGFPIWVRSLLTFAVISAGALFIATRRLRTPSESGDR